MDNTAPKITWFVSKEEQERINIAYEDRIFNELYKKMGVDPCKLAEQTIKDFNHG